MSVCTNRREIPVAARSRSLVKAVLRDPSPLRGSDRFASDVEPLVQHIIHAALVYIVARRDRVLIFASPMSEPDSNSVIERKSVCHWSRLPAAITIPVTKAVRQENTSSSCRIMTIGNPLCGAHEYLGWRVTTIVSSVQNGDNRLQGSSYLGTVDPATGLPLKAAFLRSLCRQ